MLHVVEDYSAGAGMRDVEEDGDNEKQGISGVSLLIQPQLRLQSDSSEDVLRGLLSSEGLLYSLQLLPLVWWCACSCVSIYAVMGCIVYASCTVQVLLCCIHMVVR